MNNVQVMNSDSKTFTESQQAILIVEDDEPLLKLLRFFLDDAGYRVMCARNGEEAIETYVEHRADIGLVLTDLGLPGLTGKEEVLTLGRINPDVRIICASGFLDPKVRSEMMQAGVKAIVNKPYEPQEILRSVRSVLASV